MVKRARVEDTEGCSIGEVEDEGGDAATLQGTMPKGAT